MSPHIMPPAAFLQEQSKWCWAATAELVLRCLGITYTEQYQECFHNQCILAHKQFAASNGAPNCCPPRNSNAACPYNDGVSIQDIQDLYDSFGIHNALEDHYFEFQDIVDEIDQERPVQVLFMNNNGFGGHTALIYGYEIPENEDPYLIINDPLEGWDGGHVTHDFLVSFYDLRIGSWAKTIHEIYRQ